VKAAAAPVTAANGSWGDLDFELPEDRIAQRPLADRDASRLLCVRRQATSGWTERRFGEFAALLRPGDVLVRNVTRVLPARLHAVKLLTGTHCEILLLEPAEPGGWWALVRPGKRLTPGSVVQLDDGTPVAIRNVAPDGRRHCETPPGIDLLERARALGSLPLPPYIRRRADAADTAAYQTVYARVDGSVAAPTAGLHFTPAVLDAVAARGVTIADLVLHVGIATFQPLRSPDPELHTMHWERFEIPAATRAKLVEARRDGRRIVAVGTTVVRAIE
jgi:S-adenosylmethionine:tRNA ribosyltransferase-isomerase